MAVTAVTGEIGSGKSTLSRILSRLMNCAVIDADKIAAKIWTRDDVKNIFVSRWGNEILDADGNIIKPKIAEKIFTDDSEHKFCDSIIHPLVMDEIRTLTENIDAVAEIPLLPEAVLCSRPEWITRVIYTEADFSLRAERCRVSRGWSYDELMRREKFLLPKSERLSICDYVIRTEGSLSDLRAQAVKFLQEIDT